MKRDSVCLDGRVALVTGAGSGIGLASAKALAAAGAKVALLSRSRDELEKAAADIKSRDGEALVLQADVSDDADLQQAIEQLISHWGQLDIVYANAGINGVWAPIDKLTVEEWRKTLDINLTGTFLTIKYAEPYLRNSTGGSVIITSSVNGTRMFSNTGATAYSCSKAGQVALAKMLALELARYHIRVNVVCPGAIESAIEESTERRDLEDVRLPVEFPDGTVPLKKGASGKAEEVADLVLFLASDASRHISGTEIFIDGAQSLLQG